MVLIEACLAMALLYALLSIVASAGKEAIEAWLQKRKGDFRGALRDLLQEDGARQFLEHPRIRALTSATTQPDPDNKNDWPSYVDPKVFAAVAVELAREFPQSRIGQVAGWAASAGQGVPEVLQQVYSDRMERLSGSFKRNAQKSLLVIGMVVAIAVDADTIQMMRRLTTDAPARSALAQLSIQAGSEKDLAKACGVTVGADPQAKASQLISCVQRQAPDLLGWNAKKLDALTATPLGVLIGLLFTKTVGYLLTAIAISLGAAFWFDLISKVANIRSTSKSPRRS
ncbi:MAG: hypothetical protein V4669_01280 [Pseudomonadota bacterium]